MDRLVPTRRPPGPPTGFQQWRDLLFVHWEVDSESLSRLLPPGLSVDTFQGRAFLGLVPFHMQGVRPRGLPAVPWLSNFAETNVRTYVHVEGENPGIYFFSLDAARWIAVRLARAGWHLPYHWAEMEHRREGNSFHYRSVRHGGGAELRLSWEVDAPLGPVAQGSLEFFLAERYFLYTTDRRGRLLRGQVHHPPYPLYRARAQLEEIALARTPGIELGPRLETELFSPGVDVEVFALQPVDAAPSRR